MIVFIYCLSDPRSDEVRYVGKAFDPDKRYYGHVLTFRSNTHKTAWIKKLKSEGLKPTMEILEKIDCETDDEWQEAERWWISYLRFLGCRLTNLESGGRGGKRASQETKAKQSAAMKRFYEQNPEQREARSRESTGRKHKPEDIAKMSAIQSKRPPERIEKMRQSAIRRGVTPQFLEAGKAGYANLKNPATQAKRLTNLRAAAAKRKNGEKEK